MRNRSRSRISLGKTGAPWPRKIMGKTALLGEETENFVELVIRDHGGLIFEMTQINFKK